MVGAGLGGHCHTFSSPKDPVDTSDTSTVPGNSETDSLDSLHAEPISAETSDGPTVVSTVSGEHCYPHDSLPVDKRDASTSLSNSETSSLDSSHAGPISVILFEESCDKSFDGTLRQRSRTASQTDLESASSAQDSSQKDHQVWTGLKLFAVWAFLIVSVLLRGGKGGNSIVGVRTCSMEYWLVMGLTIFLLLTAGMCCRHPSISVWKCFATGVLSAIVGIGGGMIMNPMLLASGIDARKSTATVAVMIMMVSSSCGINFALDGAIPLVPALILASAGFIGSLSGKTIIGWLVNSTGRTSILILLLAGFMAISGAAACAQGLLAAISANSRGQNPFLDFSDPCA